jgi:hypothetical protein
MIRRLLPLSEPGSLAVFARRTRLHWAVLVAALVCATATAVVLTRTGAAGTNVLPGGGSTVVVIDLSGSTQAALRQFAGELIHLTQNDNRDLGLVVFSDTGYEALPIGSSAEALRGWLTLIADGTSKNYPWTPSFSGGTVISNGLSIARRMLLDRPAAGRHVLLVSDLVDGVVDLPSLQSVVAQYQRDHVELRVVKVTRRGNGGAQSSASFLGLPNADFVSQAATRTMDPAQLVMRQRGSALLVGLIGVIAVLAGAYELLLHPLTWRRT